MEELSHELTIWLLSVNQENGEIYSDQNGNQIIHKNLFSRLDLDISFEKCLTLAVLQRRREGEARCHGRQHQQGTPHETNISMWYSWKMRIGGGVPCPFLTTPLPNSYPAWTGREQKAQDDHENQANHSLWVCRTVRKYKYTHVHTDQDTCRYIQNTGNVDMFEIYSKLFYK